MSSISAILETRALKIGYRSKKNIRNVADNLNLRLMPGQLVCLLGSNGAGKSTLMRTLSGLQPVLGGEVYIDGALLSNLKPTELARKLSVVLTDRIEAGNLTAREVITLGRTPYTGWLGALTDIDHEKISEGIRSGGVEDLLDRHIHQLSDGERQKVMLARALVQDTPLILLDEPTAHLDLPNRVEMMRLLHVLARHTGKAILLSTHELDLALQTADEVWLMSAGGALITGVPEDLVLNGSFEAVFAKNNLFFDRTTGSFHIHTPGEKHQFYLEGDEKSVFWTKRALQREGWGISRYRDAACVIASRDNGKGAVWEISLHGKTTQVASMAALIQNLRLLFSNNSGGERLS
jgi:iron complex transport system ATP-binding protein